MFEVLSIPGINSIMYVALLHIVNNALLLTKIVSTKFNDMTSYLYLCSRKFVGGGGGGGGVKFAEQKIPNRYRSGQMPLKQLYAQYSSTKRTVYINIKDN